MWYQGLMKRLTKGAHQTSNDLTSILFNMLHFEEQLFTGECSAKYAYYFYKNHLFLSRQLLNLGDVSNKKLELQIFWTLKINEFYLQL